MEVYVTPKYCSLNSRFKSFSLSPSLPLSLCPHASLLPNNCDVYIFHAFPPAVHGKKNPFGSELSIIPFDTMNKCFRDQRPASLPRKRKWRNE